MPEEHKKPSHPEKSSDYVEIKVPKLLSKTAPVNLILLIVSIVFAFLLGALGMRLYQFETGMTAGVTQVPTDAIAAFTSYAKQLKLDTKQFASCLETGKYAQKIQDDYADGQEAAVNATPTFFINGQILVGAQPYGVIKAVIEQELTGIPAPTPTPDPELTETPTPIPARQNVSAGNLPPLGNRNAKVTVVEFSDFQCPFCKRFFDETFAQIKKEYIDTGKIQFTYRHYPLDSIHPNARKAGEASECANDQGKFWEYHDLLFQQQDAWANLPQTPVSSS